MAGNHFKNTGDDGQRPPMNSSPKKNEPTPRSNPGETAMFVALHEQSKKRDAVATSGRRKIPAGGPAKIPEPRTAETSFEPLPPLDADKPASDDPFSSQSDDVFQGSGAKEEYFDFNLPYGSGDSSTSYTDEGLVKHRHRKGRRKKKTVAIVVAAIVAVVLVAGGVSGFMLFNSAKKVQADAQKAMGLMTGMKDSLTSGDFSSLTGDVEQIDELCSSIRSETDSPVWQAASFIPVVGGDVSAARTLVSALSEVCSDGLVPVSKQLAQATPGKLIQAGGTVNVSAFQAIADSLADSSDAFKDANEKVQAIGPTHIDKVTKLVDTAKDGFAVLDSAVDAASKVAPVLPQMLGANGQTRNYLVIAENNVEIRARGGFGGSQGVISVTDGTMQIGDFKAATSLSDDQALPISDEEETLFTPITHHMGTNSGDALYTPDFPRGASLAAQLWEIDQDQHIDGVVAMDPVFLQYLLGLVGSVSLPDGTVVDGSNAAKVLMHDVYWNYPVAETDGIFASVAGAAFDKVVNGIGDADMVQLVSVFKKGCEQGRFIAWMSDEQEENALKEMGIAAALPSADDLSADPVAGVYVNNYSFSKIDWYLNLDAKAGVGTKSGDGTTTYQMTVTLTNTLKNSEVDSMPDYVANSVYVDGKIANRGDERLGVYLYAPAGGSISNVQVNGSNLALTAAKHNGLDVQFGIVDLLPEETCTITYSVTTSQDADGKDLTVSMTPTCQAAREGDAE